LSPGALALSGVAHLFQLVPQTRNPVPDAPPVHFQFGFAGAPGPNSASQTRKQRALARKPRQQIIQLGKLHLKLAFARARAAREDVKDELRAVENLAADPGLEVSLLTGSQLFVEDNQIEMFSFGDEAQLLRFPASDEKRRVRLQALLQGALDDSGARGFRQRNEFIQRFLGLRPAPAVEVAPYQSCSFSPIGCLDWLSSVSCDVVTFLITECLSKS
jgi:hypothetical protein